MHSPPSRPPQESSQDLLEFPLRIYTALRTMRLYPPTNPQVIRTVDSAYQACKRLLDAQPEEDLSLALSGDTLLIAGQQLDEKDQNRPQIKGLITFLLRLNIHSLTFKQSFSGHQCSLLIEVLAQLFAQQEISVKLAELLAEKDIQSVHIDEKRYVAVHKGEQVVRDDQVGSGPGMPINDEELSQYILGHPIQAGSLGQISSHELEPFLEQLAAVSKHHQAPEELNATLLKALQGGEQDDGGDPSQANHELQASATSLAGLDPTLLNRLLAALPPSRQSEQVLNTTLEQLSPHQLNRLVGRLLNQLNQEQQEGEGEESAATGPDKRFIKRLLHSNRSREIKQSIARNADARQLLENPDTTLAQLPAHLLERLREPQWSAPVLVEGISQAMEPAADGQAVDPAAINRMLSHYEQLLDQNQQQQVAVQAGAQLAQLASGQGLALGNIMAQRFKGLFGEQLYSQLISQVSDELLDETIEHLDSKQLNRMVAMLSANIPLAVNREGDPDFTTLDDEALARLTKSSKGDEVRQAMTRTMDARQLLENPDISPEALPPHLRERLREPQWSAPVLVEGISQAMEPATESEAVDPAAINRMLSHYEQLLDQNQQQQVTVQAGAQLAQLAQLASGQGLALGNVLAQRFKGLFGEQLYSQLISQVSDELLDETIAHLDSKQLNRMVAMLSANIPLAVNREGDPNLTALDDEALARLTKSSRGNEVRQAMTRTMDARQLLENPDTSPERLPPHLRERLREPQWSAPVLVEGISQAVSPDRSADREQLNRLLANYDQLLSPNEQAQVAQLAGLQLADLEETELGLLLVRRFKGIFGKQLYSQIIEHLSDAQLGQLGQQLHRLATGLEELPADRSSEEISAAYNRLKQTAQQQKMRAVVDLHTKHTRQQEQQRQKRVQEGIQSLLAGEGEVLEQEELCQAIPETISRLLDDKESQSADNLLIQLAITLQSPSRQLRHNGAAALASTAEQLAGDLQWPRLIKLLPALEQALQLLREDEPSIKKIITSISRLAEHYLDEQDYSKAYQIVHLVKTFSCAAPGTLSHAVQQHGISALDRISSRKLLEQLLADFLHGSENSEYAANLLTDLGKKSVRHQLQYLMASDSKSERKQLLSLIRQSGQGAGEVLIEQLEQPSPWYVCRNIIRLLGEIGRPSLLPAMASFTGHSDLRVQQETLSTAAKLGGKEIQPFLVQALAAVDDSLKVRVVHQMNNFPAASYVAPLSDILEGRQVVQPKNKQILQLAICRTLATIGSKRAIPALQHILRSKNLLGRPNYSDELRKTAKYALDRLRRSGDPDNHQPSVTTSMSEQQPPPAQDQDQPLSIQEAEAALFRLAEQGKTEEAKRTLFELIVATAKAGDFADAERLRERIYEIDPMALSEIIRSGEIIEQEKSGSINEEDLTIWAELTDQLSSEEFQTIYHEFHEQIYAPEENIVSQGDENDALYFINQGSIKVSHQVNEREIFITSLGRGELIGENFFSPSVWTISLTALTEVRLYSLKQQQLDKWLERFPGLRAKLKTFYDHCNKVPATLKKKRLERRQDQRFTLSRKIQVQPLDKQDKAIGRGFRAEIADISRGGLSFLIRISKQENARLLLGRRLQVILPVGGKANYLYLKGRSIGVQPHDALTSDYSVHFQFASQLDQESLQHILG
ncbi:cyclic nucleotide-binding domain-containing protein [Desulfogranum mediterraneum]|uniref:cyclic nucleotide-binding domain-containing protein n=1 Tax=Desulfogranum mediterraneum TaxID=160661 RepID=UPI0004229AC7|nr:cyclic nucleotide-binding domain-containing protein [Desulfogranum mediterraneum]